MKKKKIKEIYCALCNNIIDDMDEIDISVNLTDKKVYQHKSGFGCKEQKVGIPKYTNENDVSIYYRKLKSLSNMDFKRVCGKYKVPFENRLYAEAMIGYMILAYNFPEKEQYKKRYKAIKSIPLNRIDLFQSIDLLDIDLPCFLDNIIKKQDNEDRKEKIRLKKEKEEKNKTVAKLMKELLVKKPMPSFEETLIIVKKEFPESKFNKNHFNWYKNNMKKKGLL